MHTGSGTTQLFRCTVSCFVAEWYCWHIPFSPRLPLDNPNADLVQKDATYIFVTRCRLLPPHRLTYLLSLAFFLNSSFVRRAKVGVIVNDMGSVNIDQEIARSEKDGVVSLANGCVCCALRGDLLQEINSMAVR